LGEVDRISGKRDVSGGFAALGRDETTLFDRETGKRRV
jgi:hypothetical protein